MNKKTVLARIDSSRPLTDSIWQLILRPEEYVEYRAGQYLNILHESEELSYSIANAPLGAQTYELHIRHTPENRSNQNLLTDIKQNEILKICLPFGDCYIEQLDPEKPILFIAGGTGFAPIKAMIEQLLAVGDKRPFELFWGVRSQSDLYLNEQITQWQADTTHFRYFSFLPNSSKETLASLVIERHREDLCHLQFVISGPFDMVYVIRDCLVAEGLPPTQLFSDAFSFERKGV